MKIATCLIAATCFVIFAADSYAGVMAGWTFETSVPTTGGPHAAENGIFAAYSFASTNSGGTVTNPAGNGSPESFSSNGWNAGEYYQFTTSTVGFEGVTLSYAQATSATGPRNFQFQYSTNGTNYLDFGLAYIGPIPDWNSSSANMASVLSYDLSSITGLNNASTVGFRIAVVGSTAENMGTIGSSGTFRVDDFMISANPAVPEPTSFVVLALGAVVILVAGRYRIRRTEAAE